jgi:hypothetical protein
MRYGYSPMQIEHTSPERRPLGKRLVAKLIGTAALATFVVGATGALAGRAINEPHQPTPEEATIQAEPSEPKASLPLAIADGIAVGSLAALGLSTLAQYREQQAAAQEQSVNSEA